MIEAKSTCIIQEPYGFDGRELLDDFSDAIAEGKVIGSHSTSGHKRVGIDEEHVFSIDNGALRIAPLIEAGFGRAVIAYGPFYWRTGLAFSVCILNGHNTAQAESLPETFRNRLALWFAGSRIDPRWLRLIQWFRSGRIRRTLRQFRWWKRTAKDSDPVDILNENLAVGWFPMDVVKDPRQEGNAFIMHALGPENGELWIGENGKRIRCLNGVQNLPLYLIAILRPEGIVYYVSSMEGASGMVAHPHMRPVALEYCTFTEDLYLGIQQSVIGQIGWRLDSRIRGVRIAHLGGYSSWCGGAIAADRFVGYRDLDGSRAELGGKWRVLADKTRCGDGSDSVFDNSAMAILDPESVTGMIHAIASLANGDEGRLGLIWRFVDDQNHWRMEVDRHGCEVIVVEDGGRMVLASSNFPVPMDDEQRRLQVLDDGTTVMAYVDGEPITRSPISGTQFNEAIGVGILMSRREQGDGGSISLFEAHPRTVEVPETLDMGIPSLRKGDRIVAADDFEGVAGDIEGRPLPVGMARWSRLMGSGIIELSGDGAARIRGSVELPCPGRTAYCVDWNHPEFADLETIITPPGTARGQKHQSTAGFIVYQDAGNYVTLNVWRSDYYGGASISTFFKFDGFEDIYDAIWTNVADRVYYGRPSRIRLCCDGERYLVYINDEPVLYRAFRDVYPDIKRLQIHKVGLLANWEFGTDTGSKFEQFRARL